MTGFAPGGEVGSTLLIDEKNQLWALNLSGDVQPLPFSAPDDLLVTDIATAGADLYVLDSSSEVIYRFGFVAGGFTGPSEVVTIGVDVSEARYLLIDEGIVTVDSGRHSAPV